MSTTQETSTQVNSLEKFQTWNFHLSDVSKALWPKKSLKHRIDSRKNCNSSDIVLGAYVHWMLIITYLILQMWKEAQKRAHYWAQAMSPKPCSWPLGTIWNNLQVVPGLNLQSLWGKEQWKGWDGRCWGIYFKEEASLIKILEIRSVNVTAYRGLIIFLWLSESAFIVYCPVFGNAKNGLLKICKYVIHIYTYTTWAYFKILAPVKSRQ
jgi:hypothetical protein